MTEVLALRALGLGDLLTAVPALRALRRMPGGAAVVLAAPAPLARWFVTLGIVDEALELATLQDGIRLGGRDLSSTVAVNLHGRGPQSHRVLRSLGPARLVAYRCPAAGHSTGPVWVDDEHEVDRWLRLTATLGVTGTEEDLRLRPSGVRRGHVVVHPGAAAEARRWPADRWSAVVAGLVAEGHEVVVTGGQSEIRLCAAVAASGATDLAGALDLPALAEVVGTAALLLSGDTGVAHLATAFGTRSVTLFGPISPALWGPRVDADLHVALWAGRPGALREGDPHGVRVDPRLASLEVASVLDAARRLLGSVA